MTKDTTPVEVNFDAGEKRDVAIAARDRKKARTRERMLDRHANERLGVASIKLRLSTYTAMKQEIEKLGIKTIAHCEIMVSRSHAEDIIGKLDALDQDSDGVEVGVDYEKKLAIYQLKLECAKVMVSSAAEHLRAERQPQEQPPAGHGQLAFPAGTSMLVTVGGQPEKTAPQIEE